MMLTERQYERIARRLDGEHVPLDGSERAALGEIADDEAAVGAMLSVTQADAAASIRQAARLVEVGADERILSALLDAEAPSEAIDRAWQRTQAALARPQRRLLRLAGAAGAIAAAAAAVLIVSLASHPQPAGSRHHASPVDALAAQVPVDAEVYAQSVEADHDPAIRLLAAEIDQLEADVLASAAPTPVDAGLDHAERAIEEFWLEEPFIE